jgi:hypothetical protein
MLEFERQFRRVIDHRDFAKFALAVERDIAAEHTTATQCHAPIRDPAAPEVVAHPLEIIHTRRIAVSKSTARDILPWPPRGSRGGAGDPAPLATSLSGSARARRIPGSYPRRW